jgi:hypothetical protein
MEGPVVAVWLWRALCLVVSGDEDLGEAGLGELGQAPVL